MVIKPFGIKGAVLVKTANAQSKALSENKQIFLQNRQGKNFSSKIIKTFGQGRILLEDISTRDQAEALRGYEVLIARDQLTDLDDSEFYLDDILNFNIIDTQNNNLGTLKSFSSNNAQTLLVIKKTNGQEAYVPLVKPIFQEIVFTKKQIILDPPAGLLSITDIDEEL